MPTAQQSAFPASIPFARRTSTTASSNASNTPFTYSKSSASPSNVPTTTPTGIPVLRSLRSLLPFAPNKQPTPISATLTPSPNPHRTTFVSFGSVRKSFQRERVSSSVDLPSATPDVQTPKASSETVLRRSLSCSTLALDKPLPREPDMADIRAYMEDPTNIDEPAPVQRSPSPEPLIPNDLSTILEADTSGLSRQAQSSSSFSSRSSSPARNDECISIPLDTKFQDASAEQDDSFLNLSTENLAEEIMHAIRSEDNTARQRPAQDTAVVADATEEAEHSVLDVATLDPDLAALLSPNNLPPSELPQNLQKTGPHSSPLSLTMPLGAPIGSTATLSRLPKLQSSRTFHPPSAPDSPANITSSPSPSAPSFAPTIMPGSTPSPTAFSFPFRAKLPTRTSPSISRSIKPDPLTRSASSGTTTERGTFLASPFSEIRSRKGSTTPSTPKLPSPDSPPRACASHDLPRLSVSSSTHRPSLDETTSPLSPLTSPISQGVIYALQRSPQSRLSVSDSRSEMYRQDSGREEDATGIVRPRSGMASSSSAFVARRAQARTRTSTRERSVSVHDARHQEALGRSAGSGSRYRHEEGVDVGEFGEIPGRSASSLSGRMTMSNDGRRTRPLATEWLSPRTVKAFRAAGLLGAERDRDRDEGERLGGSGMGIRSLGRASGIARSSSDYAPRGSSRMAFSEIGSSTGGSRRGRADSSTGFGRRASGVSDSPTYTGSSPSGGSRDLTPRSGSTAPTSVSGSSFAFGLREREREWERDEMRDLTERHATETGALLSALSDSQRMTRLLRRENEDLRMRLERLESMRAENEDLRRMMRELRSEMGELRGQVTHRGMMPPPPPPSHAGRALGAWTLPDRRSGLGSAMLYGRDEEDLEADDAGEELDLDDGPNEFTEPPRHLMRRDRVPRPEDDEEETLRVDLVNPISSTPAKIRRRRLSTASSVLPSLPANMTMLLHDHKYDGDDNMPFGASFTADFDSFRAPAPAEVPPPLTRRMGHEHPAEASLTSNTTTELSMASTASARSLFLRPEHEVHLDDLRSLDLGHREDEWLA